MWAVFAAFIEQLEEASDEDEIWGLALDYFATEGAEWLHYVYAPPVWNMGSDDMFRKTNTPDAWRRHYREQRYHLNDPATAHCWRSSAPFLYGLGVDDRHYSRKTRQMYAESADWGANCSVAFPVRSMPGSPVGAIVCITGMPAKTFAGWWAEGRRGLHLAALALDTRMVQLANPKIAATPDLSARERECLRWLATGLRTDRIAHRLNISTAAVDFYFASARRKLGAQTRDQALLKAMMLGKVVL